MKVGSDILLEALDKWYSLEQSLEEFGLVMVQDGEFSDVVTDLNRNQHSRGERADGSEIEPEYTGYTIRRKIEKGQPYDRVTLEDTGDYHESLRVKIFDSKIEVISGDWKADMLDDKYGGANQPILGLQPGSVREVRVYMLPKFLSFVKHYFNLS